MLKVVSVRLVDRQQCQEKLRTTRLTQYFRLHRSFICAQGLNGRDTCTVSDNTRARHSFSILVSHKSTFSLLEIF